MRLGLLVHLAWRGLLAHPRVTALMLGAMAAAVGFQIPNEANLAGYRDALLSEGVQTDFGAVRVTARNGGNLRDADALATRLARAPEVRAAVPLVALPAVVRSGSQAVNGVAYGVARGAPERPYRLVKGRHLPRGDRDGVLLGVDLARDLGVRIGDRVTVNVVLDLGPQLLEEDRIGRYWLVVRGLVSGVFGAHEAAYLDRSFLAAQTGRPDEAALVLVYCDDPEASGRAAATVRRLCPACRARTWQQESEFLRNALGSVQALATVSTAMGLTAVALPVLALLYIDVLRRRREIALLVALGLGRGELFAVFLLQASLSAALAVLAGCALGAGLVAWFTAHPIFELHTFVVRPVVSAGCFVRPGLAVLATATLAGALPAWLAARTPPARVLRGVE